MKLMTFCYSRVITLFLFVFVVLSGCTPTAVITQSKGPATVTMKASSTINGMRRSALVHIPVGYDSQKKYPLVVVIHGAFSTAEKIAKESGFNQLADEKGFIVLYPNGMGLFGLLQHWNAGQCCGKALKDNVDDVGFITECIEIVSANLNVDATRLYITGFSNGGMMVYRYVSENSSKVAAFASLGASIGGRSSSAEDFWLPQTPIQPVPALILHGSNDRTIPLDGGVSPQKGGEQEYLPTQRSVEFWLGANSCTENREEQAIGEHVRVQRWKNCANNSAVEYYVLEGWGHQWPGPYFTQNDTHFRGFDAARIVWNFFVNHSL